MRDCSCSTKKMPRRFERTVLGDLLLLKIKEPRLTRDQRYDQDVERSLVFRRVGLLGLGLGLADRLHVGHGT